MTEGLRFEGVGKHFGDTTILSGIEFECEPGELVVLVGPSGCGKSTLLRMVAGLESVSEGAIYLAGRDISSVPPERRGIGMVFQSYALYPHMTVRENLAFPLTVRKAEPRVIAAEVGRVASLLSLGPLLDRLPKALSGGQRQRVAIGRCLVRKPELYCFDEPLSNLDAALRSELRIELRSLQRQLGKTTLYVTHDQVEAMTMADKIVALDKGRLQQFGTPEEVYVNPANCFVARLVGSPAMNLIVGSVREGEFSSGTLRFDAVGLAPPGAVLAGIRPEHLTISEDGALLGRVVAIEPVGDQGYVHLEVFGIAVDGMAPEKKGSLTATLEGTRAFRTRVGAELRFDVSAVHVRYFDVDTRKRVTA